LQSSVQSRIFYRCRAADQQAICNTQTFARPAARFDIGSFFNGPAAPAFFQPLPFRGGLPIPTIVVEETDDGR